MVSVIYQKSKKHREKKKRKKKQPFTRWIITGAKTFHNRSEQHMEYRFLRGVFHGKIGQVLSSCSQIQDGYANYN